MHFTIYNWAALSTECQSRVYFKHGTVVNPGCWIRSNCAIHDHLSPTKRHLCLLHIIKLLNRQKLSSLKYSFIKRCWRFIKKSSMLTIVISLGLFRQSGTKGWVVPLYALHNRHPPDCWISIPDQSYKCLGTHFTDSCAPTFVICR